LDEKLNSIVFVVPFILADGATEHQVDLNELYSHAQGMATHRLFNFSKIDRVSLFDRDDSFAVWESYSRALRLGKQQKKVDTENMVVQTPNNFHNVIRGMSNVEGTYVITIPFSHSSSTYLSLLSHLDDGKSPNYPPLNMQGWAYKITADHPELIHMPLSPLLVPFPRLV